jgi:hypothetical protein
MQTMKSAILVLESHTWDIRVSDFVVCTINLL